MKKLTNTYIDQTASELSFTIQLTASIDLNQFIIFVDECDNINNMYSDQSENHSYYFNKHNSNITITDLGDFKYDILIQHDVISDMNDHMKYIKVISGSDNHIVEGVYYNQVLLFNAELTKIKKTCNMCLDDKSMRLVMHVVFKRQLLESALETEDYNQCMLLYNDLCKLLDISKEDAYCECTACPTCCGGCCSLR